MFRNVDKKIVFVFAVTFLFWVYLAFATRMTVAYDSVGYEESGQVIRSEGLKGYLKGGPQREPLYACSIAGSMRVADRFGINYKKVQTVFQMLLLLFGQILLYHLLRILQINRNIIAASLLYYGFSPGLVSCGFDLFSEIVTLPFILLSVILACMGWKGSLAGDIKGVFIKGLFFTAAAVTAMFSKAVLTVVYPLFVLPFVFLLVHAILHKNKKQWQAAGIFLVTFFLIFYGSLSGYKLLNKKYNGTYAFTDNRGTFLLYTLSDRRTAPLTKEVLGISLLSVPGQKVCASVYGEDACRDWLLDTVGFGTRREQELRNQGIPPEEIRHRMLDSSIRRIAAKPFQYAYFVILEALRMTFWESTKAGFVSYPPWLTRVHDFGPFKNGLRLLMGILTLTAFVYLMIYILRTPCKQYLRTDEQGMQAQCALFMFLFLMFFIGLYSLFTVLVRYSFPIAPLFIAAIAFGAHKGLSRSRLYSGDDHGTV